MTAAASGPAPGAPSGVRQALPWVLPFAVFMLLLAVLPLLHLDVVVEQVLRIGIVGAVLLTVSRPVIDLRVRHWVGSTIVGAGVFALWIAPDLLVPGWHDAPLFSNDIVGRPESGYPEAGRANPVALVLRTVRAALIVPLAEELFWRGWLPRWMVDADVSRVPLGTFTRAGFWITAILFASEHGSYWDVGLMAGVAYNWWMLRTRSLGDCILAHAVTNGLLSAYVIGFGEWRYW